MLNITPEKVRQAVANACDVTEAEFLGDSRAARIVRARGYGVLISSRLTGSTLIAIAPVFGYADHSGASVARRQAEFAVRNNPEAALIVGNIERAIAKSAIARPGAETINLDEFLFQAADRLAPAISNMVDKELSKLADIHKSEILRDLEWTKPDSPFVRAVADAVSAFTNLENQRFTAGEAQYRNKLDNAVARLRSEFRSAQQLINHSGRTARLPLAAPSQGNNPTQEKNHEH